MDSPPGCLSRCPLGVMPFDHAELFTAQVDPFGASKCCMARRHEVRRSMPRIELLHQLPCPVLYLDHVARTLVQTDVIGG
jgi:hypothetical protein